MTVWIYLVMMRLKERRNNLLVDQVPEMMPQEEMVELD
jgi:hypothetical protein